MLTLLSTLTLGLPVSKEPMALDAKVEAQRASYANSCGWSYNPHMYPNTMTSTNVVKMDGQAVSTMGGALGAFIGNTCHGISTGKAGPPFGQYGGKTMYMMSIGGEASGATLTYKYCKDGVTYTNDFTDKFVVNANRGNAFNPQIKSFVAAAAPSAPSCSSWSFNLHQYQHSMTGVFKVGNWETDGTLAAFVGDEIRGLSSTAMAPPFAPAKPAYHMMVYANKNWETVKYKYCKDGVTYDANTMDYFKINRNRGNAWRPRYVFIPALLG